MRLKTFWIFIIQIQQNNFGRHEFFFSLYKLSVDLWRMMKIYFLPLENTYIFFFAFINFVYCVQLLAFVYSPTNLISLIFARARRHTHPFLSPHSFPLFNVTRSAKLLFISVFSGHFNYFKGWIIVKDNVMFPTGIGVHPGHSTWWIVYLHPCS